MAGGLIQKTQHNLNTVAITQLNLWRELEDLGVQLVSHGQVGVQLSELTSQPSKVEELRINWENDPELQGIKQNLVIEKSPGFVAQEDCTLRFQNRICIPKSMELRKQILDEAHNTRYSVHSEGTKMYGDLRQYF